MDDSIAFERLVAQATFSHLEELATTLVEQIQTIDEQLGSRNMVKGPRSKEPGLVGWARRVSF